MNMIRFNRCFWLLMIFFIPHLLMGANVNRPYEPVIVKGQSMTLFHNAPVADIYAYAYKNGGWIQIPFQIDEKDAGIDFFGVKNGTLDTADELVFMAVDVGDSVPDWRWINDEESKIYGRYALVVENSLVTPATKGWVYIYRSSTLSHGHDSYMTYIPPTAGFPDDMIRGVSYLYGYNQKGIPTYLAIKPEVGGSGVDILDRWKIRYEGKIFGFMPFKNDEDNGLLFRTLHLKTGPVRIFREAIFSPVWGEAVLPDSLAYTTVFYPCFTKIEAGNRSLTSSVGMLYMRQSVDYAPSIAVSYFHNPNNSNVPIDGVPDVVNRNINTPGMNWFMIQGPHGTITTLVDVPVVGIGQNLFYNDSSGANQYDTGDMIAYGETGIEVFGDAATPISGTHLIGMFTYYLGPEQTPALGEVLMSQTEHPLLITASHNGLVIPVELAAFSAEPVLNTVKLVWRTASESNNYGFNIERKTNVQPWQDIAFVPGYGTSANGRVYQYCDNDLAPDVYHYRLRQVDIDGTSKYSDPIEVQLQTVNALALQQNYPNPFNPHTEISFTLAHTESSVVLTIFNMAGQEVCTLVNGRMNAGLHHIVWNGADNSGRDVPSGLYVYRLSAGGTVITRKMCKIE
jgi:hypothetical protein